MSAENHPIRRYPHPDLAKVSVTSLPNLAVLLDCEKTMNDLAGVAIAANQTGRQGRFFVMRTLGGPVAIESPHIGLLGPWKPMEEGCLSLPGQFSKVMRSERVAIRGFRCFFRRNDNWDSFTEVWTGHEAQVAQHEIDHLNGKVFIDHLEAPERSRIKGNMLKLRRQGKLKP